METAKEQFLTAKQLATQLDLCIHTVYRAAAAGRIPGAVRIGRSIRFPPDTVVKLQGNAASGQQLS